jgi:PKD repeat protein
MKVIYFLLLLLPLEAFGKTPDTLWSYIYGSDSGEDYGQEIILLSDSSYLVTGSTTKYSDSNVKKDFVLLNISQSGELIQEKYYDRGYDDNGMSVLFNKTENSYSIAGYSNYLRSGNYDIYINKLDSVKDILWEKFIGGTQDDRCTSHIQLSDGFIVVGYTNSYGNGLYDFYLLRLNNDGDTLWTKTYGGESDDFCSSIFQTTDGGLILTGTTNSFGAGGSDIWTIKTNENGDTLWTLTYGSVDDDEGNYVAELSDGTYAILGMYDRHFDAESAGYDISKIILLRIDPDGNVIDSNLYGPEISLNYGKSFKELEEKNIIITGSVLGNGSNGGTSYVLKVDSTGNEIWSKNIQIGSGWDDFGNSILSDYFGNYIVTGTGITNRNLYNRDLFFFKIESDFPVANFSVNPKNVLIPSEISFTDVSTGLIENWQWDFENDGIIDSYQQNPVHTYLEADTYSVKLIVSNQLYSDTLVKEDLIIAYNSTRPVIISIEDVPEDQGGWVRLKFVKSVYDTDSLQGNLRATEFYTVEMDDSTGWMAVNSTGAYGSPIYSVLTHTTYDSTSTSNGLIAFRVIAFMNEGNFVGDTVQGYSVDNLAPGVPPGLMASVIIPQQVSLSWNMVLDEDFNYFRIYRSLVPNFQPSISDLIYQTVDTTYIDQQVSPDSTYYYRVSAIDFAGNQSGFTPAVSATIVNINYDNDKLPDNYIIQQNYPNPFNPSTTIRYAIPRNEKVSIKIYNILGREIRTLINKIQAPGWYLVKWDGKDNQGRLVSNGIYFYRISAGEYANCLKMLYLK